MSKSRPKHAVQKAAADAVVELALVSLGPEYQRWDQGLNMSVVELVWNAHSLDSGPVRCNLVMSPGMSAVMPPGASAGVGPGGSLCGGPREGAAAQGEPDPALERMLKKLVTVRAMRWGELNFLVLGLSVHAELASDDPPLAPFPELFPESFPELLRAPPREPPREIVFRFDLTWDEGETFHPCEIVVDRTLAGPADVN